MVWNLFNHHLFLSQVSLALRLIDCSLSSLLGVFSPLSDRIDNFPRGLLPPSSRSLLLYHSLPSIVAFSSSYGLVPLCTQHFASTTLFHH